MKKKIFSELLMGAFLLASISSFVSCKDYDDDIKDLQEQVNSLSGVVTQKETTINSSITSLQAALTTLENAYKTGDDATLAAAKQALADAKKALEDAIKANYDSQVTKNAELDAAIIKAQAAADQALKQLESKADVAQITQLQQDLQAAQAALQAAIDGKAAQAEVDALNTEVANLKKAQADAESALAKVQTDLANAQTALQDAIAKKADQATLDALQQQVDALKTSLEAKDKELADAVASLENAQKALNDAIAKKADQSVVEALQKKVADLQTALEAKDVELANGINEAKKQISEVSTSLSTVESQLGTLSTEVAGAVKDIADLQVALAGQKKALEDAQAALEKAIADNATAIGNNATAIGNNATAILNNGKSIEENKQAIADNLKLIEGLQTSLTQLDTDMKKLIADEIKKVNDVLGTKASQADLETLKDAHNAYVAENDKAVEAVRQKAQAAQDNVDALSAHVDEVATNLNTLIAALAKDLRSLVYRAYVDFNGSERNLFIDGIETIEYPYLIDTTIVKLNNLVLTRQRNTPYAVFNEDYKKTMRSGDNNATYTGLYDWNRTTASTQEYYGPVWPVTYHLNPTKASPAYSDVLGWSRRNAEVMTRSTAGDNGAIKTAQYYSDASQREVYSVRNGVLTVGLQVTQPQNLANHNITTEADHRPGTYTEEKVTNAPTYRNTNNAQYDDIIALQVNTKVADNETKTITSDYAMIYPEGVWPEAIVWTKHNSKLGKGLGQYDEDCPYLTGNAKKIHVWDTPQEALGVQDASVYPDIMLYYNNQKGIKLSDLLGIHLVFDDPKTMSTAGGKVKTIKLNSDQFKHFGLTYKFELVDYTIDGNVTHDSKYCTLNQTDGTIIAKNVKEDGTTIDTESATSVGREPLVRVLVSRDSRVLLDGYILVHITKDTPETYEDLIVDNYPKQAVTWNLCGDLDVFSTNWSQFSKYVLTDKLDNMTKDEFDTQYGLQFNGVPDLLGIATEEELVQPDNSKRYDDVMIFNDNNGKPGAQANTRDLPGQVRYYHNSVGTTNHRFVWAITDDELEEYTHENASYLTTPRTITKWFRYSARPNTAAKYRYIWVKMTFDLTRGTIATESIKEKNNNYWYKYTGIDDGYDAIIWNPWYPQNGGNTKTYRQFINSTFTGPNLVNFVNKKPYADNDNATTRNAHAKYFFTPYEFEITAQDGTKYTITARSGKNDERWNAFVCRYVRWENDGTPSYNHILNDGTWHNLHYYNASNQYDYTYRTHKWGTPAQNKAIHQNCAIYTGAFNGNTPLLNDRQTYAEAGITGGVYDNNKLYAVKSSNYNTAAAYTEIATLNQNITSGQMDLTWRTPDNDITKEILNAVGYEENNAQILRELHTMVGVVGDNGCYVALDMTEYVKDEANTNASTFYVSWKRPINVLTEGKNLSDAVNNGDSIPTLGFVTLYDWRGPVEGKMYDQNQWLWAYYNVKSIIVNTEPSKVMTNMHQTNPNTFKALSSITTDAELWTLLPDGTLTHSAAINLPTANGGTTDWPLMGYNSADKNNQLRADMGIQPEDIDKLFAFAGGIIYMNNGDHVTDFDVIIPVTINYDWGRFITNVKVHIHRTLGN